MPHSRGCGLGRIVIRILPKRRDDVLVAVNDEHRVYVVFVTPTTSRITVGEEYKTFWFNVLIFEIVEHTYKVCTTTTLDFVVYDRIQVF